MLLAHATGVVYYSPCIKSGPRPRQPAAPARWHPILGDAANRQLKEILNAEAEKAAKFFKGDRSKARAYIVGREAGEAPSAKTNLRGAESARNRYRARVVHVVGPETLKADRATQGGGVMGKLIDLGYAKLGEVGLLGASFITGANLCPKETESPPATPAKAARPAAASTKVK